MIQELLPDGVKSFADLLRGGPPPRLEWTVKPLLPRAAFGVLAAPRKYGGKTWFELDAALSVAAGVPALGGAFPTLCGSVVLISPEHGEPSLHRRGDAVARSFGDALPQDFELLYYTTRGVRFLDPRDVARLRDICEKSSPVLLVIDSAFKALQGTDFSKLAEVGAVLDKLQDVAASVGATILLSHHTVKQREARGLDRLSGVGLAESADVVMVGDRKSHHILAGRTVQVVRWEVEGRDIPGFAFDLTTEIGPVDAADPEGALEYSASVRLVDEDEGGAPAEGLSFLHRRVLNAVVLAGPCDLRRLGDVIAQDGKGKPLRRETIEHALGELLDAELVDRIDGLWVVESTPTQPTLGGDV